MRRQQSRHCVNLTWLFKLCYTFLTVLQSYWLCWLFTPASSVWYPARNMAVFSMLSSCPCRVRYMDAMGQPVPRIDSRYTVVYAYWNEILLYCSYRDMSQWRWQQMDTESTKVNATFKLRLYAESHYNTVMCHIMSYRFMLLWVTYCSHSLLGRRKWLCVALKDSNFTN